MTEAGRKRVAEREAAAKGIGRGTPRKATSSTTGA